MIKAQKIFKHIEGEIVFITDTYCVKIRKGFQGWQAGFEIGVQLMWMQSNLSVNPEENTREYAIWQAGCIRDALEKLIELTTSGSRRIMMD